MSIRRIALLVVLGLLGAVIAVMPASAAPMTGPALVAQLSGPVPGQSGTAWISINVPQGVLCYSIVTSNLAPVVAAHIHAGGAGVNGSIVVPFFSYSTPSNDSSFQGCVPVDRALAMQILTNPSDYYVNVHTTEFPTGAIRGQLQPACTPAWCASASPWKY